MNGEFNLQMQSDSNYFPTKIRNILIYARTEFDKISYANLKFRIFNRIKKLQDKFERII